MPGLTESLIGSAILLLTLTVAKTFYRNDPKTGYWYVFNEAELGNLIGTLLSPVVLSIADAFEPDADGKYDSARKQWFSLYQSLGDNMMEKIVKQMKGFPGVVDAELYAKWNDNSANQLTYLMPWKNGVLELKTGQLTVADPNWHIIHDHHSQDQRGTTGVDFLIDLENMPTDLEEVRYFLRSICDTDEQFRFCLFRDACKMLGMNRFEEIEIGTGIGQNGKSKYQELMKNAFKELCGELDPSFYQKARVDPNTASGFLVKLKCCLIVFSEEPEKEDKDGKPEPLLAGRVKKITGRSHIECRGNYKDSGSMLPKFDPHFIANEVPNIRQDPAVVRSLFVRKFNKFFKDTSVPANLRQLQEFQAKDPAVTPERARWSATELDDKVKSVGGAGLHLPPVGGFSGELKIHLRQGLVSAVASVAC